MRRRRVEHLERAFGSPNNLVLAAPVVLVHLELGNRDDSVGSCLVARLFSAHHVTVGVDQLVAIGVLEHLIRRVAVSESGVHFAIANEIEVRHGNIRERIADRNPRAAGLRLEGALDNVAADDHIGIIGRRRLGRPAHGVGQIRHVDARTPFPICLERHSRVAIRVGLADNREHVGVAACPGPAEVCPRVVQRLHKVDNLAVNPGRDVGRLIESRTSQLSHRKRRGAHVVFGLDGDVVAARLERAFRARRLRIAERSIVGNAHAIENSLGSCLADRHDLRTVRHLAFREEIVRR